MDNKILVRDENGNHLWLPINTCREDRILQNVCGVPFPKSIEVIVESEDFPTWILYCTINKCEPYFIAVVDNEIDAVRISQKHIEWCGETHRPHMHMMANKGSVEIDPDRNLYRVSDAPLGTKSLNSEEPLPVDY